MQTVTGTIQALRDHVIVTDMDFGERVTSAGIVLLSDDGKSRGIRPRWGQVLVVGPEQTDVTPGQWVLVEHGRWTRGFRLKQADGNERVIRRVEAGAILAVSDTCPNHDETINGDAV
jgi:Chaperonin 10 Kd subunit